MWYVAQVVVGVLVVAWGRGVVVVWGEERLIIEWIMIECLRQGKK